ncbi:MAG: PspA/IM30 family protein [Andreesenia angusta]|nr:PspA/IM30 family protein [Andreesenia angusta]
MASILTRFKDIMSSNINSLLDKAEDPVKLVDEYLRQMENDLGRVKSETATVMAEAKRAKREVLECEEEINKMTDYAKKALEANNESDARRFLEKRQDLEASYGNLKAISTAADENAIKVREMHDKLTSDINELRRKKSEIKSKLILAETKNKINMSGEIGSLNKFEEIEKKADLLMDKADAMEELNSDGDDIDDLMSKYESGESSSDIDKELEALKSELNK